ncbi:MAG: TonB-dependent receptor [Parvibaculum sedimenti]|uniref:TonB-dependent receptor plug domain-containing protein n=1 Tax=Parvibaculum sedimenti TaxID=2608632 RepID=UPI003BB7C6D5
MNYSFFGWPFLAATLGLSAFAATPALADTATLPPEILVTSGSEPLPTKEVASSYTIITAQEIEAHQYRTLPQALASVPGVTVIQSGGTGSVASIFMRGTNSNQTLVLLNGQRIGDPSDPRGAFNAANLTLDNVERIEIVRGPQSALYGSQAMGGVINIITKQGKSSPTTTARIEAGTLGTLNTSLTSAGNVEDTNYFLSLSRQATDGNDVTPARLRFGAGEEKDASENMAFSGQLDRAFNEYLSGSFFVQYNDNRMELDEGGYNSSFNPVFEDLANRSRAQQAFVTGSLAGRFADGKWRPKFTLAYSHYATNTVDYPDRLLDVYSENINTRGERVNAALDNAIDLSATNTLTFGADYSHESFSSNGLQDFDGYLITPASSASTNAYGLSLSDHQTWGENWFATASLRYDMPSNFKKKMTWSIAPGYYIPSTDTRFTASYATSFKVPSLYQRFGYSISQSPPFPASIYTGNPNLKAEESRGWELGLEQGLVPDMLRTGVTYFDNRIENAVSIVYDLAGNSTAQNTPAFNTHGVEAFIEATPLPSLTTRLNYTLTVLDADTFSTTLTRRPRHTANWTTEWKLDEVTTLGSDIKWVDPYLDITRDTFVYTKPGSYLVVNLSASRIIAKGIELTARVNNLLDRQYEPANGFQAPGIEALAGIAVTF